MNFDGVNVTASGLVAVEAIKGVSWYNVTAIETTGWSSDFQIFGHEGYDLIPVPFLPSQGAFLSVGASNYSEAASAATAFDSYMFTTFVSYSNSSGSYTFYSPLSFANIIPSTLLKLVPTEMGGFASAISSSAFVALKSPMVILQGTRGSSGFVYNLTLGSIATNALDTSYQPNILKYFGTTLASLSASSKSVSSTVVFRFLDGIINSTDHSAVTSRIGGSAEYSLSLAPGAKVGSLNVTVLQAPPLLLAERIVDTGVLMRGQNMSVSISLSDLSNTTISTVRFSDNWWKDYGFFKLVSKSNSTVPSLTLNASETSTPTYELQYTGNGTQQLTIPAMVIQYSFKVGAATFKGHLTLNPVPLSLGIDEPDVYAYVTPAGGYGASAGNIQHFDVVAKNVGTRTAVSVVIAGQQEEGGLIPGGSDTVNVSSTAESLIATNFSKSYTVSYTTPEGQSVNVSTNTIPVIFSHSKMKIGFPTLTVSAAISPLKSGVTNLTLTYASSNQGLASISSFEAEGSLPAGLPCGKVNNGTGLSCSGGRLSLSYSTLASNKTLSASMQFNLTSHANYFFSPLTYQGLTSGFNLTGLSNALAVPTGLTLTKQFASTVLFSGMSTEVTMNAVNSGPFDFYNITIETSGDVFDIVNSSAVLVKFSQAVTPGGNVTTHYGIVANPTFGNQSSSVAAARLFFGGTQFIVNGSVPVVRVYQSVSASIKTSPASPNEGKAFSMEVTLTNPSAVTVSNVRYILPIPSFMSLSNFRNATFSAGDLNLSVSKLGPHDSYSANMTVRASSGVFKVSSTGKLTFLFSGMTLNGNRPTKDLGIGEDVLTRYILPTILVLVAVLAAAFYVRRKAGPTVPASRQ